MSWRGMGALAAQATRSRTSYLVSPDQSRCQHCHHNLPHTFYKPGQLQTINFARGQWIANRQLWMSRMVRTHLQSPWTSRCIQRFLTTLVADCVVCGDPAEEIPPCSHGYCWDCLTQLVRHACQDGERWPPRCCNWVVNIDSPANRENLPAEVVQLVEDSKVYYSTYGKLFCCNSKCRKYIPPGDVDEFTQIGFCRSCWGGTCALCRRHPHVGNCRKDFQQKSMEKYWIYMGMKRCEQCGRIVERAAGCNHIV